MANDYFKSGMEVLGIFAMVKNAKCSLRFLEIEKENYI